MSKISVITTTYKHQDFIAQTIESILGQTYTDRELLIGDDSPDDATRNLIQGYVSQYPDNIKARHHNPNKGIVDNMNFLIAQASKDSEYIAFLEGDDIYTSDNLSQKIKIFENFPDLGMVYNNLDFINENGKVFKKNFFGNVPYILKNQRITAKEFITSRMLYLSFSSLMLKKDVLHEIKIKNPTSKKMFMVSDRDVFFRICTKYQCYGIEDSMTLYRIHQNNTSSDSFVLFQDLEIQIQYYLDNNIIDRTLYLYRNALIHLSRAILYLEKGQRSEALQQITKSFKFDFFAHFKYKIAVLIMIGLPQSILDYIIKKYIKTM